VYIDVQDARFVFATLFSVNHRQVTNRVNICQEMKKISAYIINRKQNKMVFGWRSDRIMPIH